MEEEKNLEILEKVESLVKEAFFGKKVRDDQFIRYIDALIVLSQLKNKRQDDPERLPKLVSELMPLKHLLGNIKNNEAYVINSETTINRQVTITYSGHKNGPEDAIIETPKKVLKIDVTVALDKDKERIYPKKEIRCFDVQELGKEMAEDILERIIDKSRKREEDVLILVSIAHKARLSHPNGEVAIAKDIIQERLKTLKIKHKIAFVINSDLANLTEVIYLG